MKNLLFTICLPVFLLAGCSQNTGENSLRQQTQISKAIQRYLIDFWINKDTAILEKCITPDMIYHYMGRIDPGDPESQKKNLHNFRTGFPMLTVTIDKLLINGDMGAAYTTWTGTQSGPLLGIPPSGKTLQWSVSYFFRMKEDRIAELWEDWNEGGVYYFLLTGKQSVLPESGNTGI